MKRRIALLLSLLMLCTAAGTLPVFAEADLPALKVLGTYNGHDANDDPTQQAIEEMTGYRLEYFMLPSDNASEKLMMEIASGVPYDILRISPNDFRTLMEMGALLPLDGMLAEYGPNLLTMITEDAYALARKDGQTYGLPMMTEKANIGSSILMRQDILDALGLALPRTKEDFRDVLQAVKTAYPEMVPLTFFNEVHVPTILSAFGVYFNWNEVDGKLVHKLEMPQYKEYLAYMLDLYKAGLIDQDLAINTKVNVDEKFSSGKVFAIRSGWFDASTQVPALLENVPEAAIAYLDPLEDANGNAAIAASYALNNVSCIPKTAENPEHAVQFMNKKFEPDIFTFITLGVEGEHFYVEEGKYYPIMPIFSEFRGNAWWYLNSFDMTRYGDMWMARTRRNPELGKAFDAANANFDAYAVYDPVGLAPALSAVDESSQVLGQMLKDYTIQLMVGVESLENYDAFVQKFMDAGGRAAAEAYNEWYANR